MTEQARFCQDARAMAVYQDHLDRATAAALSQDAVGFHACIKFPWRIETQNVSVVLETYQEAVQLFEQTTKALHAEGVTDLIRIVQSACFITPDIIEGSHITHRMCHSRRQMNPYHNRIQLMRDPDHRWRETDCSNALHNKAGNLSIVDQKTSSRPAPFLKDATEREHK